MGGGHTPTEVHGTKQGDRVMHAEAWHELYRGMKIKSLHGALQD